MGIENNRKYIAEAWIENGEDEEFKKSFLKALIDQWQGHLKGFDADTVDGLHGTDITEMITDATKNFIETFRIGNTIFKNNPNILVYYLGFEGIKLYNKNADSTGAEKTSLPWSSVEYDDVEGRNIPNLYEVFEQLYELTYIGEQNSGVTNKSLYDTFKEYVMGDNGIDDRLKDIETALEGKIIDGLLDASSINGIRFYIYNTEEYEDLKNKAAQYNPDEEDGNNDELKNAYEKLNDVRNVFIIKTKKEIEDSGFQNGVYTHNPDIAIIDKYYQFRVIEDSVYDEDKKEYVTEKWLQYKYENQTVWTNLCKASDFIDENTIESLLIEILNTNTNYTINSKVVEDALKNIEIDDNTNIPLVTYTKQNFLKGAFYTTATNKIDLPTQTISNSKYLDLTPIQSTLSTNINQLTSQFNSYKTELNGRIGTAETRIGNCDNNITNIKGGSSKSLKNLEDSIDSLDMRINNLSQQLSEATTWELIKTWTSGSGGDVVGRLYAIKPLKIAWIGFPELEIYNTKDSSWKRLAYISDNLKKARAFIENVPKDYTPSADIFFATSNPRIACRIRGTIHTDTKDACQLQYRTYDLDVSKSSSYDPDGVKYIGVGFKGVYRY